MVAAGPVVPYNIPMIELQRSSGVDEVRLCIGPEATFVEVRQFVPGVLTT